MLRIVYEGEREGAKQDELGRWVGETTALFYHSLPEALIKGALGYEFSEDVDDPKVAGIRGHHRLGMAWGFHTGKRVVVQSADYGDGLDLLTSMVEGRLECKVGYSPAPRGRR